MSAAPPQTKQVLARVFVNSLDEALPRYEELVGQTEVRRLSFRGIELAWVGPFLLLAGNAEVLALSRPSGLDIVGDVERVAVMSERAGGKLVEGPDSAPNGMRLIARHPDGSVFEYLQITVSAEER